MNLRTHVSSNGVLFLAGRNDSSNEELVAQVGSNELVFHTDMAGSPFVNIKGSSFDDDDVYEACVMCARYSRDWKTGGGDVVVHRFVGGDVSKKKGMKLGTFGVRRSEDILVQTKDIIDFVARPATKGFLIEKGFLKNVFELKK